MCRCNSLKAVFCLQAEAVCTSPGANGTPHGRMCTSGSGFLFNQKRSKDAAMCTALSVALPIQTILLSKRVSARARVCACACARMHVIGRCGSQLSFLSVCSRLGYKNFALSPDGKPQKGKPCLGPQVGQEPSTRTSQARCRLLR